MITNDDGVDSVGLRILRDVALTISDDVWVVAPDSDRSGSSRSLSLGRPMSLCEVSEGVWSLSGTPSDCVIMGARHLVSGPIDLVLSGINDGQNVGDYVNYSGTVAGALEGSLLGIRSISFSQCRDFGDLSSSTCWDSSISHCLSIIRRILRLSFPLDICLNVNFPNCLSSSVLGSRICRCARLGHSLGIEEWPKIGNSPANANRSADTTETANSDSNSSYWLSFSSIGDDYPFDTDISVLSRNYISISPLCLDITSHSYFSILTDSWDTSL